MKKEKAKTPENNRAAVYARYSSRKQGEQSIEGQLSEAYKYAETHGYNIIHEYIDRAKSGRTDNRQKEPSPRLYFGSLTDSAETARK